MQAPPFFGRTADLANRASHTVLSLPGHACFVLLSVMACFFYQQRLYTDSAFYIYHVVNGGAFHIEVNRFVLAFSQVLPLVLVKLECSLRTVLIGYSIGHVLFYYLVFCWLAHVRKEPAVAFLLVLAQVVGIMSGYFTPMFELYYCTGLLVALYVALKQYSGKRSDLALIFVLVFFISTGHPVANVLLLFVLVLHACDTRFRYYKEYIVIGLFITGVFLFKLQTADAYEQGKSRAFAETLRNGDFGLAYWAGFARFMWVYYKDVILLGTIAWAGCFFSGRTVQGLIYTGFLLLVLVMINGAHYGFGHTRYQEQVYFPLNFMVCFPFVIWVVQGRNRLARTGGVVVLAAVMVFKVSMIVQESNAFTGRTHLMKNLIARARSVEGSKFMVPFDEVNVPGLTEPNWSYAPETLLLSAIDGKEKTVTICTSEDLEFNGNNARLSAEQFLFRRWEIVPDTSVNPVYFFMQHGKYQPVPRPVP